MQFFVFVFVFIIAAIFIASSKTQDTPLSNPDFEKTEGGNLNVRSFEEPSELLENQFYLTGNWDIQTKYTENKSPYAKIIYRYQAKDVFMMLSAEKSVLIKIFQDGKNLGNLAGQDVDTRSYMWVNEERLYNIVRNDNENEYHTLEMIIGEPGLKNFNFISN